MDGATMKNKVTITVCIMGALAFIAYAFHASSHNKAVDAKKTPVSASITATQPATASTPFPAAEAKKPTAATPPAAKPNTSTATQLATPAGNITKH